MKNLDMFCICLHDNLLDKVKKLQYVPVGVGSEKFSKDWLLDSTSENISLKNKFYGEYTFHFWFWKNMLHKIPKDKWIGFCAYRRFWLNENYTPSNNIYENALNMVPDKWNDYDAIIGDQIHMNGIKWIKIIKYGKIALLRNPLALLKVNKILSFSLICFMEMVCWIRLLNFWMKKTNMILKIMLLTILHITKETCLFVNLKKL